MGSQGQINTTSKDSTGMSSLMNLMNMYQKMSGSGDSSMSQSAPEGFNSQNPSTSQMPEISTPQIGDSAMSRRVQANENHPDAVIARGLTHADDPNLPLDFDTRMAVMEPLLRAQHGVGAGYQKGSQGTIKSGKQDDAGGLGKIASLVALA